MFQYIRRFILGVLGFSKRLCIYYSWLINRMNFSLHGVSFGKDMRIFGKIGLEIRSGGAMLVGDRFTVISGMMLNPMSANLNAFIRVGKNARLVIGDNVGMSSSVIWCDELISIENSVMIGAGTIIADTDCHSLDAKFRGTSRDGDFARKKAVRLCRNCFIGARCFIAKGVCIGENSVVGAGSVVVSSIPPNEIWGGAPARFIRKLN